jgi:dehydrogenase/reductase SDR family member 4
MKEHTTKKVAVIQAGTSGIGLATAHRLLTDGYFVVVSSRREGNVERAVATLKHSGADVMGVVGHAAREEDRVALADAATSQRADGAVHALVCNAATSVTYGPLLETDAGAWAKMLDTNVSAAMLTVREFARRNAFATGAAVVLVGSIGGYSPLPGLGAYSVTKTALLGLCRALAEELAPAVRVNCVAPGIIRTKFSETLWRAWDDGDATTADIPGDGDAAVVRNIGPTTSSATTRRSAPSPGDVARKRRPFQLPLDRLGRPEDVSGVVAFLLSDDASYVTGETVVVAGGLRSRL